MELFIYLCPWTSPRPPQEVEEEEAAWRGGAAAELPSGCRGARASTPGEGRGGNGDGEGEGSARGREPGARRCTQPAAGHLRVGYRYNPLLACLEAWALGSRTSARIPSRGLERRRIGGGCSENHTSADWRVHRGLPVSLPLYLGVSLTDKEMSFFSFLKSQLQ